MKSLTFSDFAKILHTYCGCGNTKSEFVITLTNQIMGGRPGSAIKGDKYKNPMIMKEPHTLRNYYNGTRSISQGDASLILSRAERYKFEEFLRKKCSEDALSLMKNKLYEYLKKENADDKCDIVELCADVFIKILENISNGNGKKVKTKQA